MIDGHVLTDDPLQIIKKDWRAHGSLLQLLVSHNAEEMRLYHVPSGGLERFTEEDLKRFMQDALLPLTPYAGSPGEWLCELQSAYYYGDPAQRLATIAGAHAQTAHRYRFDWSLPQHAGRLGAEHGVELPFVFDARDSSMGRELKGPHPPLDLARRVHAAWASFARTGDLGLLSHAGLDPWTEVLDVSRLDAHCPPQTPSTTPA